MQPDDKTQAVTVLSKGTVINHYRIIEKIGAGGMGEVYLAEDTELNRKVALKFLSPHFLCDADCVSRFQREAQAVAKLNHPNIVTIYEVSEYQGRPFFAMEYVEGQPLSLLIKQGGCSLDKLLDLATQICDGLSKAHQAGIVHRDVKPANILIDGDGRPKIADFGLATIQGSDQLTGSGSTLGTIGYMSPEQLLGETVDQRSDIFSLGVILYQMLTGQLPFKGDYEATITYAIVNIEPEPLPTHLKEALPRLQGIIDRALRKDRIERYQQMTELLVDLKCNAGQVTSLSNSNSHLEPAREASVAVLPFVDMSPEKDQEYFCDGIAEELINALTRAADCVLPPALRRFSTKDKVRIFARSARC